MNEEEKHHEERKIEKLSSGSSREVKDDKGRFDLLSPNAIKRVAKRLEFGAKKYGDNDWKKGIPNNMLIDSSLRHIFQHLNNENDEDHLASAVTNLMQIMEQEVNK